MDRPVSDANPPRGYYAQAEELRELITPYDMSLEEIERIVRFVYLWIQCDADMIPYDIELALGVDGDGHLTINVLDFGMVTEREDTEIDRILPRLQAEPYVDFLGDDSVGQTMSTLTLCEKLTGIC